MTTDRLACFKAYDIRGRVPSELDEELARNIGRAYAEQFHPRKVVIGRDMRLSSSAIAGALCEGFLQAGVDVMDDVLNGVIKSFVFGVAVTFIALYQGYEAKATPEGVSRATNPSATKVPSALNDCILLLPRSAT